jgi:eukaryotic-like serine/threonine-protein kinase
MECARCATPVPDNAKFCHGCGSLVSGPDGTTAAIDSSELHLMEGLLRSDTQAEFRIERLLGRGGMAVVYLATEIHLDRKVAIKVLPPELTFGQGVERFKREAKTAAALDHPHIIPIYRVASGSKIFWYAMKYLEGRSLEDVLKERHRLPLDETIAILDQVAKALDHAHRHHVIHRDVKPANIMLDAENRVVVTDFGIAKALTAGALTASGSVIGTPYYMSPEQAMGGKISGASDQYSVAVLAYRMLSGHVLFDGESPIEILHKHCMAPPPSLETANADLPPHVYHAVQRALAKKAEQRYPSVGAFVEGLKRPALDVTVANLRVEPRPRAAAPGGTVSAPPHARKRIPVAAISAAVGVAVLVLVAVWMGRRHVAPSGAATTSGPAEAASIPAPSASALPPSLQTATPAPAEVPRTQRHPKTAAPAARTPIAPPPARPPSRVAPIVASQRGQSEGAGLGDRGILKLVIDPEAELFIDEVYMGLVHSRSDTLPAGPHLVRLEREGFRSFDTTLTVGAAQVLRIEFRLKQR